MPCGTFMVAEYVAHKGGQVRNGNVMALIACARSRRSGAGRFVLVVAHAFGRALRAHEDGVDVSSAVEPDGLTEARNVNVG